MFKYTTIAYIYRSYGFSLAKWAEEHREALELWPGLILTQTCMENDPDEVFQVSEKWLGLLDKLKRFISRIATRTRIIMTEDLDFFEKTLERSLPYIKDRSDDDVEAQEDRQRIQYGLYKIRKIKEGVS